jgi:hypothetical protein
MAGITELPLLTGGTQRRSGIGADALRISALFRVSRDGQEREQASEDNPNVHAHQGKPSDAWEVWNSAQPLYLRAPARQPSRIAR